MSWSRAVYSTMVSEVGYDEERQMLTVTWTNGRRSGYQGVPEDKALELANAPSVGQMINREIKPFYSHEYL